MSKVKIIALKSLTEVHKQFYLTYFSIYTYIDVYVCVCLFVCRSEGRERDRDRMMRVKVGDKEWGTDKRRERVRESQLWLYSQAHSICISDLAAFPKPATSVLSLIKVPRSPPMSARTGYCGLILNKFPHSHKTCPSGLSLSTPHSLFLCLLSLLISLFLPQTLS